MDVSVCMITYNHEEYISEAINSILKQQTDFNFELIIGEDLSTDTTRAICEKFVLKYPGRIILLESDKRYGMMNNFIRTLKSCKGKYIAVCEGDDYWTNKNKLQIQVDFLKQNHLFSLCCHDVYFQFGNKKKRSFQWDAPAESDIHYLLKKGNYISTLSIVFRKNPFIIEFLNKFQDPPLGDYILYVAAAHHGKIKFFKKCMGVYRVHGGGAWSQLGLQKAFDKSIRVMSDLFDVLDSKYHDDLRIQLLGMLEVLERTSETEYKSLIEKKDLKELIQKMGIQPFLLEYIKHSVNEKMKSSYYSKNIPVSLLINGLKEKFKNKIPRG